MEPLERLMREGVANGVAPGIVAAVTDRDTILYQLAAGVRSSASGEEMRPDTVFRIASMTKLVTSLAIMMLVEEGKIELDQPFAAYFPEYRQPGVLESFDAKTGQFTVSPARGPITVRQLLTHTSGYGYWFLDPPLLALMKGVPNLSDSPFLMRAPGERFAYGVSTDVMGQAIEPVSGMPLEAFFAKRIFGPLAMSSTSYRLPGAERLAAVHARGPGGFIEQPNEAAGPSPSGGGGLYSTAADYLALLRVFLRHGDSPGGRLIASRYIEMMTENQIGDLCAARQRTALPSRTCDFLFMDGTQKIGFGVLIEMEGGSAGRSAGSYGWGGIYNTYFWVDPRAGFAAVLLMQTSPFSDPSSIDFYRRFERAVYAARFAA
jgi:CubicO group peptidase (beta-lactamase class C family)